MRDANGVYVGERRCVHHGGLDRMEEHTCCGGKRFRVAFSKCGVRGVVRSEHECSRSMCDRVVERRSADIIA